MGTIPLQTGCKTTMELNKTRLAIVLLFLSCIAPAVGQVNPYLRSLTIAPPIDSVVIDTLSIVPGSLTLTTKSTATIYSSDLYTVNFAKGTVVFNPQLTDTLIAHYQAFPVNFTQAYWHRDYKESLSPDSLLLQPKQWSSDPTEPSPWPNGLEVTGSVMRGVGVGNNQDATVSSSLNLQINGNITDEIRVEGAIADRTVPFQPEGNTRRLQEFEKVYLKVYTNKFAIRGGDIDISPVKQGLLTFNRNVKGISYTYSPSDSLKVSTAFAVARGKFARNQFAGAEGNQGPYRLMGTQGESYIVVLAGSERVYVDGVLLQRGADAQYTIDYNLAEVVFTPLFPITSNSRIAVEFEYSEMSFARFTSYIGAEKRFKRISVWASAFSESDSKNQPLDQDLSPTEVNLLKGVGDNLNQAWVNTAQSTDFDPEKLLYQQVDTTVNGATYTIFRQTSNPSAQVYQVTFSYVGEGKGSYTPDFGGVNGRVYKWVAPTNGLLQGSYEPKRLLVTPKQKQLFALGSAINIAKKGALMVEGAVSRNDLNRFSTLDAGDDVGAAFTFHLNNQIGTDSLKMLQVGLSGSLYHKNFSEVDRIQSVEHSRDWNLPITSTPAGQKFLSAFINARKGQQSFGVTSEYLLSPQTEYTGYRNGLNLSLHGYGFNVTAAVSHLQSADTASKSNFTRLNTALSNTTKWWQTGVTLSGENNHQKFIATDIIAPTSIRWQQAEAYLGTNDTLKNRAKLFARIRTDWNAPDSTLRKSARAVDLGITSSFTKNPRSTIRLSLVHRTFTPYDTLRTKQKPEETILAKGEYAFRALRNSLTGTVSAENGSGLEAEQQYYFFEVPAGQGIYTWKDYNNNGVRETNEFEIAQFKDEATFIRINSPTNKYIRVRNGNIAFSIEIWPERAIRDTSLVSKVIKRFSNQLHYQSAQKRNQRELVALASPFGINLNNPQLISYNESYRNSLAINRFNRQLGFDFIMSGGQSKQVLTNGFEVRQQSTVELWGWLGLGSLWQLRAAWVWLDKEQKSELFTNRDYSIAGVKPELAFRFNSERGYELELGAEYKDLAESISAVALKSYTASTSIVVTALDRLSMSGRFSISKISFNGDPSTPVGYEMLQGLTKGTNAVWEATIQRKLSALFQLELMYNGRRLGNGNVVNAGVVQVRAIF